MNALMPSKRWLNGGDVHTGHFIEHTVRVSDECWMCLSLELFQLFDRWKSAVCLAVKDPLHGVDV